MALCQLEDDWEGGLLATITSHASLEASRATARAQMVVRQADFARILNVGVTGAQVWSERSTPSQVQDQD